MHSILESSPNRSSPINKSLSPGRNSIANADAPESPDLRSVEFEENYQAEAGENYEEEQFGEFEETIIETTSLKMLNGEVLT